jgi:hypothetical protein
MAGAQPDPTDLGQDGVARLRDHFQQRFSGDGTLRGAIDGVLGAIAERWSNYTGLEPSSYQAMQDELGPHLRVIRLAAAVSSSFPTGRR